jgi:hypothetical protein
MSDADESEVLIVTDLDTAHAIRNALTRLNCTFEDLRDWAQTDDYPTVKHKIAWYVLGAYYDERDHYAGLLEGDE